MHDAVIMAGTAVVGGLLIDLQRRMSARQQILIALPLIVLGWSLMLAMSASGPFPAPLGAAAGGGLFLTGIVLLVPSASRTLRAQRDTGKNRKA